MASSTTLEKESTAEIKHPGSLRNFSGTWWAAIPLGDKYTEVIRKWASVHVAREDIADAGVGCKGGIETNHHINVLMGLPGDPSSESVQILGSLIECFDVEFEAVETFEGARGVDDDYRVLVMRVRLNPKLLELQTTLARLWVKADQSEIEWHHSVYRPHVTVAWIKSKSAPRYEGKYIFPKDLSSPSSGAICVIHIELRKYKSTDKISVPLRSPKETTRLP